MQPGSKEIDCLEIASLHDIQMKKLNRLIEVSDWTEFPLAENEKLFET